MPISKAKIREFKELGRKKDREARGCFIVDGRRGVGEALRSGFELMEFYYTGELLATVGGSELVQEAKRRSREVHQVSVREMEQISDTVTAQGVVAVMRQTSQDPDTVFKSGMGSSVLVAVDAVADPGNLGAIIRTCDWFGVDALLLGRGTVELYNPKVVRSTVGSIFHLPILSGVELPRVLEKARKHGYAVYPTAGDGDVYTDTERYPAKVVVVLGNEAWGVSAEAMQLADRRLAIRRYGDAESLNVGIACGIVLASIRRVQNSATL